MRNSFTFMCHDDPNMYTLYCHYDTYRVGKWHDHVTIDGMYFTSESPGGIKTSILPLLLLLTGVLIIVVMKTLFMLIMTVKD
jgi:hypothetical protein